ncbi:hypothetical protein ACFX2I_025709 [Malus domestica]
MERKWGFGCEFWRLILGLSLVYVAMCGFYMMVLGALKPILSPEMLRFLQKEMHGLVPGSSSGAKKEMQGLVPGSNSGAKVRAMRFLDPNNLVPTTPNKKKKKELGKLCDARKVFEEMSEPCVVAWNAMIDGFGKNGDMGSAGLLFESMLERDVVSWTSVISGFGRNRCGCCAGIEMGVSALDLKGDTNGWKSWALVVVQIVVTATFLVLLMLYNAAANTVLYMYCRAVNGELAMDIAEGFAREYASLPFDNEKVLHVVLIAHA